MARPPTNDSRAHGPNAAMRLSLRRDARHAAAAFFFGMRRVPAHLRRWMVLRAALRHSHTNHHTKVIGQRFRRNVIPLSRFNMMTKKQRAGAPAHIHT
jgi:hypothetical protein